MGFTDNLKRSLGFEETEPKDKSSNTGNDFTKVFRGISDEFKREVSNLRNGFNNQNSQGYRPAQNSNPDPQDIPVQEEMPRPTPVYDDYDDYDDYVIIPEQSFYEVVLIRPKSIDDVNYVIDQIVEEKNPVILDLSFLERESPANFKLAVEKIRQLKQRYGAQALLLSRSEERNLIIISPKQVRLINKS